MQPPPDFGEGDLVVFIGPAVRNSQLKLGHVYLVHQLISAAHSATHWVQLTDLLTLHQITMRTRRETPAIFDSRMFERCDGPRDIPESHRLPRR